MCLSCIYAVEPLNFTPVAAAQKQQSVYSVPSARRAMQYYLHISDTSAIKGFEVRLRCRDRWICVPFIVVTDTEDRIDL